MHLDQYLTQYWQPFIEEFKIPTEEYPRRVKLFEEVREYRESVLFFDKDHADAEAIDVLITAIALCQSRGIHDMLHQAAMKLEATTERYRALKSN